MPLLKWLLRSLLIAVVFIPFAALLPLASVILCRYEWGAQLVFWSGPWSCAFWTLIVHEVVGSRCWHGAEAVRQWRASNGGYLRTVAKGTVWMFGGLFFSYACEGAMLYLRQQFVYSAMWLPLGTYAPVAFTAVWCSHAS